MTKNSNPVAVIISDIHYNLQTLELADKSVRQAISKANELKIPLIVAGDLHDTKANMRAECVNTMLDTFSLLEVPCFILRGNHDQINEKSESHSLNFLAKEGNEDTPPINIVDRSQFTNMIAVGKMSLHFIPYQHDLEMFKFYLDQIDKGSTIIMHQGVKGSNAGDYMQDPTAIDKDLLADYRVISGHYHTRQDIKCGRPRKGAAGLMSYIGNPYTLNFGEANDPEKGFRILNEDGTLDFISTNLRKHVVIEINRGAFTLQDIKLGDIVKVKVTDTKEVLARLTKEYVAKMINYNEFRLELIPLETSSLPAVNTTISSKDTLDELIDTLSNTSDDQKLRLKTLWKDLCA